MDLNSYPYIPKNIVLRRYEEINIYDLEQDESYIIDEEAYSVLKHINGKNSIRNIFEKSPVSKKEEVGEAINQFLELNIIKFSVNEIIDESIISLKHVNLPEKNPFNPPFLKNLMINITEKCNLPCKHCYITDKNTIDMPLKYLKTLIEDFYNLQGIRLILTGGEPFLYSELKELLIYLQDIPLQKVILSNGVLIEKNRDVLNLLKENNIEIYVSIDGLEESHNDFRNANCFNDTIKGIKLLLNSDINVSINTMVHKQNLQEFEKLLKILNSLGNIKNWSVDIPTFDKSASQALREKYEVTPEEGGKILKDYRWGVIYESDSDPVDYACGPYLMAIDVTGVVTKCGFFTEMSPGNIFELGFKRSWELIQENCNWSIRELKCGEQDCEFLGECRGGCRYRAFQSTNDIKGIDSFKCYQFGKIK